MVRAPPLAPPTVVARPPARRGRRTTRDGAAFGVFLIALLGVTFLSGNNLLYLVVSVLMVLAIASSHLGRRNLDGLRLARELPRDLFAGQVAWGAWRVSAEGGADRLDLVIRDQDGGHSRVELPALAPGPARRVGARWWFGHRGRLHLRTVRISSRWPFGLAERWVEWDLPEDVVVLCAPGEPLPLARLRGGGRGGPQAADEIEDLRSYRPGDRLRDVHWPTSARTGRWTVVVRRAFEEPPIWLDVDPRADVPWEEQLSRATGTLLDPSTRGRAVGLRAPGRTLAPRRDGAGRRALLEALATMPRQP